MVSKKTEKNVWPLPREDRCVGGELDERRDVTMHRHVSNSRSARFNRPRGRGTSPILSAVCCGYRKHLQAPSSRSLFVTGLKSGNMFFNLVTILYLRLLSRSSDIWIFFARSSPKSQNVAKNVLLKFQLNKVSLMDFLCCCSSLTQVRNHQTQEDTTCLHRYLL